MIWIMATAIILLLLGGTPIFVVMALAAMVAFLSGGIDLSVMAIEIYKLSQNHSIITIPLFTFAGYLLAKSKCPGRLTRLASLTLGWFPGGVALALLLLCSFFTAFTGASGATIVALGGLIYPILIEEGYDKKFTLGMITTSGSLGLLLPPSLPIIIYGMVAKVDIAQLFLAGVIPSIILLATLFCYALFKGGEKKGAKKNLREKKF